MTADNVIGIFTSRAMKERGRYQIQFMKTRSSSGVGQKVDLEFNVDTLRITDLGEEEQESSLGQQRSQGTSSIYQGLKRTSSVSSTEEETSSSGSQVWERANPKEGFDLSKPKVKASTGPMIRNMMSTIASLNPEKD
jgi:hypothetical protein